MAHQQAVPAPNHRRRAVQSQTSYHDGVVRIAPELLHQRQVAAPQYRGRATVCQTSSPDGVVEILLRLRHQKFPDAKHPGIFTSSLITPHFSLKIFPCILKQEAIKNEVWKSVSAVHCPAKTKHTDSKTIKPPPFCKKWRGSLFGLLAWGFAGHQYMPPMPGLAAGAAGVSSLIS